MDSYLGFAPLTARLNDLILSVQINLSNHYLKIYTWEWEIVFCHRLSVVICYT